MRAQIAKGAARLRGLHRCLLDPAGCEFQTSKDRGVLLIPAWTALDKAAQGKTVRQRPGNRSTDELGAEKRERKRRVHCSLTALFTPCDHLNSERLARHEFVDPHSSLRNRLEKACPGFGSDRAYPTRLLGWANNRSLANVRPR